MNESPPESVRRAPEGPAAESPRGSFGAWLRHQREARSVSLREIADSSKISLRYLDALEQDRFDALPAPVFARGFLREYARVVGLNPDEVVNLFLVAVDERRTTNPRAEPNRPARTRGARSSFGYGLLLTLAVIAFLGVAAALSFYVERRGRATRPVEKMVAPVSVVPAVETPAVQSAPPAALEPSLAAEPVVAAPPQPISQPPEIQRIVVVLSFAKDCWLELSVDGRRRSGELKAGGETVSIEADEFVTLTLGNSSVVSVEVNGRPFPLPTGSTRVVRDLRIDRAVAGLPPLAETAGGAAANP